MATVEYRSNGRTYVLRGANADLWETVVGPTREHEFRAVREDIARALGGAEDAERVDASKKVIRQLWSRWPALGPDPFLDSLSRFEFNRVFYANYRDHVCHQLKVFLLGIAIYDHCPMIRAGLERAELAEDFTKLWAITAVFHDVGYVIEAEDSQPGRKQWNQLQEEYERTMRAPFASTQVLPLGEVAEEALREKLRILAPKLGGTGDIADDKLFECFRLEADRARLGTNARGPAAIAAYYNYAQKHDADGRHKFRDHGVASALLLLKHWTNYEHYIADWIAREKDLAEAQPDVDMEPLRALSRDREALFPLVCRAAGAMSLHNITPELWKTRHRDAMSAGLDFASFRICFDDAGSHKANPLAFLLGVVDTLQDWDRPTFDDSPRAGALHAEDVSIVARNGKIHVYIGSDAEEFRSPVTSSRSRYSHMLRVMKSYLDPGTVDQLFTWNEGAALGSISPGEELGSLLRYMKPLGKRIDGEHVAQIMETFLSALEESPIADAAVAFSNECLPRCHSIQAVDVLGPGAWASPRAFRYLANQLRYYARANVRDRQWRLEVSKPLESAIRRALENARNGGLDQSITLFDDPSDFTWSSVEGRAALEYSRVLLWSEDELLHPITTAVIDIHNTFHVPLFFLRTARTEAVRKFDFISFNMIELVGNECCDRSVGCMNTRNDDGTFTLSQFKNGMVYGRRASRLFEDILLDPRIMFAVDAKETLRARRLTDPPPAMAP